MRVNFRLPVFRLLPKPLSVRGCECSVYEGQRKRQRVCVSVLERSEQTGTTDGVRKVEREPTTTI